MASIEDLVGSAKAQSDLRSNFVRCRYTQAQVVGSGQFFRMTLPKHADQFCDMRSLRLRFNLQVLTADPGQVGVDAPTVQSIISRLRVLSGSQVLLDIANYNLYAAFEENITVRSTESLYEAGLRGAKVGYSANADNQSAGKEYIMAFPRGTILNTDALLPLDRLSDMHIEIYLCTGKEALSNATGSDASFTLSDIELHASYLSSASISRYFSSNGVKFHVADVSHRFNNVQAQTSLLKFSSAHSSLNKIVTILRADIDYTNNPALLERLVRGVSGEDIMAYQLFVNTRRFFDEDVDSTEQSWRHFVSAYPSITQSPWWDNEFATSKHVIVNNLQAAPPKFSTSITSGIQTAALNNDISLEIKFTSPPGASTQADSFLISDALITVQPGKSDLMVRY